MDNFKKDIKKWLHSQQNWLQDAAEIILKNGKLDKEDYIRLISVIKTKEGQEVTSHHKFDEILTDANIIGELRLRSISDIEGIENLAPRNPLVFGSENLNVIYGNNGAGKSSYSKLIKKITGKPRVTPIRHNVFQPAPEHQKCNILYEESDIEYNEEWYVVNKPIDKLRAIDIFDNDEAVYYLSKENPATYIPPLVGAFEELVKVCDEVKVRLQNEKEGLISILPALPDIYKETALAVFYKKLNHSITDVIIDKEISWTESDDDELSILVERLKEIDPAKRASQLRITKKQIKQFILNLKNAFVNYNTESFIKINKLRDNADKKRKIAHEFASTISGKLEGIGSETWQKMWESARIYSQASVYQTQDFPVLDDAKCVLCHQDLSSEAKIRLSKFEQYVKGEIEVDAKKAEDLYSKSLSDLPGIPTTEQIETQWAATDLDDSWKEFSQIFWEKIKTIKTGLINKLPIEQLEILDDITSKLDFLNNSCIKLDELATQFEKDSQVFNRSQEEKNKINLDAKRWMSQQIDQIKNEIIRLKKLEKYEKLISFTNSRSVSTKASSIANTLVTSAYIDRFNNELISLGATRLKVELIKTKAQKGKTLHRIQLKTIGGRIPVELVLSEGERRIISLAAFLADVTSKPYAAPFIFDDPISSLDQIWEEKTIERLVELSKTRQVIVFTHRLSMLGMLSDKADNINTICIRQEPWGAGEVGKVPLYGKKPEAALKNLKSERVNQARKIYEEIGQDEYYPLGKAICSDLRIITERIVEYVFLADIVQRHRRAVNTQGKIHQLAKICIEDCQLIEDIMTKYSCYEHSQSSESPVELPTPDELELDIDRILKWHAEFTKRTI